MKLRIVMLTIALAFCSANVYSAFDYLRAAEGVSYSHSHVQRTGGQLIEDPNSETGHSWVNTKLTNIEETNRIPLEKGHGFHVQLLLFTLPAETKAVEVSITHPRMVLPSGEILTNQTGSIPAQNAGMGFPEASFTYTLDEDYELVEGDWVITFTHQGDELFQITFTTYK
ncbi:MAG: hypothetical protein DRR06_05540 [Gammaproteobacteria bacterium]|nr:MAG: hypothetical protein DRR06_05540 [Gammaproteobacteria bacterium]RLA52032.1 MAG: hypothetical protein DRR42_08630 [Gammaproteobacteria bacterium]